MPPPCNVFCLFYAFYVADKVFLFQVSLHLNASRVRYFWGTRKNLVFRDVSLEERTRVRAALLIR